MQDFTSFCRHFAHMVHVVRGVLVLLGAALLASAIALMFTEGQSFGEALYLVLITGLTVGYGDIVPVTAWGRVASVVAAIVGVINVGLVVAIANRALRQTVQEQLDAEGEGAA